MHISSLSLGMTMLQATSRSSSSAPNCAGLRWIQVRNGFSPAKNAPEIRRCTVYSLYKLLIFTGYNGCVSVYTLLQLRCCGEGVLLKGRDGLVFAITPDRYQPRMKLAASLEYILYRQVNTGRLPVVNLEWNQLESYPQCGFFCFSLFFSFFER